ncbi:metallophosphoesterase [Parvularcula sp. IMCC14364]|uniref:metallophosphoesterase n=1 Tax=Parvularcula sp. IMCC14364 TaxID=3067902 RepID=UPI00274051D4|nr:metallophosphoesterase [Parvularcula sp. IMCC14364]
MTDLMLFIYHASYVYFLVTPFLIWLLFRERGRFSGRKFKGAAGLFLLGISVLAYARFVEPRILLTREHEVQLCAAGEGSLRAAVWADPQTGIFGNVMPVPRVVRRINGLGADMVFIPGDFTYYLPEEEIADVFAPMAKLQVPTFAVMGNHDAGLKKGPDVIAPLTRVLTRAGIVVLDGRNMDVPHGDDIIRIIGMRDHWTAQRDQKPVNAALPETPADLVIALQHNPDVLYERRRLPAFDLMVSGHTHGGQVLLPVLTCALTFACDVHRYGFAEKRRGNIFVSSGTGLGGIPVRFAVPPVVDVLNIEYAPCTNRQAVE